MISLKKLQKGFTIVELLIVIVVIGILAGLVLNTFSNVQKKARDTERTTDLKAIQGQLEAYYAQNAKYPTLANVNDNDTGSATSFVSVNMKGIDREAFRDPKAAAGTYVVAASTTANQYVYAVTPAGCDNGAGGDCTAYTLDATAEGATAITQLKSLN